MILATEQSGKSVVITAVSIACSQLKVPHVVIMSTNVSAEIPLVGFMISLIDAAYYCSPPYVVAARVADRIPCLVLS